MASIYSKVGQGKHILSFKYVKSCSVNSMSSYETNLRKKNQSITVCHKLKKKTIIQTINVSSNIGSVI